ncbi:MAG: ATP-binding cassette domain-containing protein [Rhodospirillales bacterium]|nr:ATP-binding cassette domain-containing protein [Rhodospirillales bacterium]
MELKPLEDVDATSKIVAEFYNVYKNFPKYTPPSLEGGGRGEGVKSSNTEHPHPNPAKQSEALFASKEKRTSPADLLRGEGELVILNKFSLRIQRGDRIGILGKNGSGKTTFLKMLIGELEPDQGRVKRRKELEFSYFDQKRRDLDPTDTLKKTLVPTGGDYIDVMGKHRHVCGYLKDFMFDPSRAQDKVSQLSGGQKNRLMLAKILANPKTCLILDEPTNDLDMDTLDMLEEILSQYTGTLIVVSHDRDFLDQTVTKILAFEGDGKIESCIGGYSDYLELKKKQELPKSPTQNAAPKPQKEKPEEALKPKPVAKRQRLSYNLERELKLLPGKLERTEGEIASLSEQLSDAEFYKRDPDGFHTATQELSEAQARLERYETRWLELEEMKISE